MVARADARSSACARTRRGMSGRFWRRLCSTRARAVPVTHYVRHSYRDAAPYTPAHRQSGNWRRDDPGPRDPEAASTRSRSRDRRGHGRGPLPYAQQGMVGDASRTSPATLLDHRTGCADRLPRRCAPGYDPDGSSTVSAGSSPSADRPAPRRRDPASRRDAAPRRRRRSDHRHLWRGHPRRRPRRRRSRSTRRPAGREIPRPRPGRGRRGRSIPAR
jgi:hypothetical protein